MKIKKIGLIFIFLLHNISYCYAVGLANSQTLQIYTHFKTFMGKPTWLLEIREVETGLVSPYIFEMRNNDNFWVAFTFGRHYKVIASTLTFGKYAVIHNFCNLEDGILSGISMYMRLTGVLTPNPKSIQCYVNKYSDAQFTIVNENFR